MINGIMNFFAAFSVEDYIFFFAVVLLIILIVVLFYYLKLEESKQSLNELEIITNKIKKEYKPQRIEFSNFEKEQEKEAIISYEELLKNSKNYKLNYVTETQVDGLTVKEVNHNKMFNEVEEEFEIKI